MQATPKGNYPAVSIRISKFVDLCWPTLSYPVAVWTGLYTGWPASRVDRSLSHRCRFRARWDRGAGAAVGLDSELWLLAVHSSMTCYGDTAQSTSCGRTSEPPGPNPGKLVLLIYLLITRHEAPPRTMSRYWAFFASNKKSNEKYENKRNNTTYERIST